MSVQRKVRVSLAVLASSLLLNVVLVSCAAESTGPQGGDPELLARLDAVMTRLTSIEAKLDAQAGTLATRFDGLDSTIASGMPVPGEPSGDPVSTLQVARVDSILALASYIANDLATPGWEYCGAVGVAVGLEAAAKLELEGEAVADIGAWAGTGAFAGVKLLGKGELGLGGDVGAEGTIGGCMPVEAGPPPPSRQSSASGDNLRTVLANMSGQNGLTQSRAAASLGALSGVFQSPATMRVQDAGNFLPVPPGLSAAIADPMGTLSNGIPAKMDEALHSLCNRSWGPRVSAPIGTACARIVSNQLDIGGLFAMADQFPELQSAVSLVGNRVGTVCSRVNSFGHTTLTIPNPLPASSGPLYSARLFPNFTTVGC